MTAPTVQAGSRVRLLCALVALALFGVACGGDGDEPDLTSEPSASATPAGELPTEAPADEVLTTPDSAEPGDTEGEADDEPSEGVEPETAEPETSSDGDGVGTAQLTVGEETWSFDRVNLCSMSVPEDETLSFLMIAVQDDLQLSVRVTDPSGEHRLAGEGVWDSIDFVNTADPSLNAWLASSETTGEQFVVIDGASVTASTTFLDLRTGDVDGIEGTLDAACP